MCTARLKKAFDFVNHNPLSCNGKITFALKLGI